MTPKNGTQHHPARKISIQTGSIPSELSISLYGGTDFLFNKLHQETDWWLNSYHQVYKFTQQVRAVAAVAGCVD
jgi:hypothetical protein